MNFQNLLLLGMCFGLKAMGGGLFEIRTRASEGIARGLFCYLKGPHIYVLHAFVKKSQKTPKKDLELARQRQKEVNQR